MGLNFDCSIFDGEIVGCLGNESVIEIQFTEDEVTSVDSFASAFFGTCVCSIDCDDFALNKFVTRVIDVTFDNGIFRKVRFVNRFDVELFKRFFIKRGLVYKMVVVSEVEEFFNEI